VPALDGIAQHICDVLQTAQSFHTITATKRANRPLFLFDPPQ
jgi:hypothetical protein